MNEGSKNKKLDLKLKHLAYIFGARRVYADRFLQQIESPVAGGFSWGAFIAGQKYTRKAWNFPLTTMVNKLVLFYYVSQE